MSKLKYPILTSKFLKIEYLEKKKSIIKIGKENNINPKTINYYLVKFNIPRRPIKKTKLTQNFLIEEFINKKKSTTEIAKELGLSISAVSKALKKFNMRKTLRRTYLGNKYGHLTVIGIGNKDQHGHTLLKCKCDCGKIIELPSGCIATNNTKSCGCQKRFYLSGSNNKGWKGFGEISSTYWNSIKKGSEERNLIFNITIEQCWNLYLKQHKKCKISGLDIYFSNNRESNNLQTASLDRIDSTKDYTLDNVQWVHKDINRMKQHYDEQYFIEMCKIITKFNLRIKE